MRCPSCKAEGPDGAAECAGCGLIFAKWKAREEQKAAPAPLPASPPHSPVLLSPVAQLAIDLIEEEARRKAPRPGDAWLLLLAFPIVVPALIVNWFMAQRWGRLDAWMIFLDGFVFTLFSLRSPRMLAAILLAWAAAIALWFRRRQKLDYGIFLGYSNAVAYPLIFGGLLAGVGLFWLVPWRSVRASAKPQASAWYSQKGLYCLGPGLLLLAWGVLNSRKE